MDQFRGLCTCHRNPSIPLGYGTAGFADVSSGSNAVAASPKDYCGSEGSGWVPDGNWGEACAWHDACYAAQSGKEYCDGVLGLFIAGAIAIKEFGRPDANVKAVAAGMVYFLGLIVTGLW
jgi:hypothetical protein